MVLEGGGDDHFLLGLGDESGVEINDLDNSSVVMETLSLLVKLPWLQDLQHICLYLGMEQ